MLGFTGNEQNYYDPENSYLNRVVDRRTGNPINLCLVYLMLARRLRLPVSGIGLPGHFVCRFQSSSEEYYINVFNRGKLWTKADCVQYLLQGNYNLQDDYLVPISPRRMLMRICGNLHQIYRHLEMTEETTRFQRYLIALHRINCHIALTVGMDTMRCGASRQREHGPKRASLCLQPFCFLKRWIWSPQKHLRPAKTAAFQHPKRCCMFDILIISNLLVKFPSHRERAACFGTSKLLT